MLREFLSFPVEAPLEGVGTAPERNGAANRFPSSRHESRPGIANALPDRYDSAAPRA